MRSLLFVPSDSERKLAKAQSSGADALILDLEDSVSPDNLPRARGLTLEYLRAHPDRTRTQLWVRINPVQGDKALDDLAAIMAGAPDGIMLPKPDTAEACALLGHYLCALEVREGLPRGSTRILPVVTETAPAMFGLGAYGQGHGRLLGMTWGAEDLSAAVGATTNRVPNGEYEFTYKLARSLCLLAATAAGVLAIDTLWSNFKDMKGLADDAQAARQAGFAGKIAIHPDQVEVINAAFTPSEPDVAFARRVVDAFAAQPGVGTLQLDGRMLDRPHLTQAAHVLRRAGVAA